MTITHLALQRQRLTELDLINREMKRIFNQSISLIKPIDLKAWQTFVLRVDKIDISTLSLIESFGYFIVYMKWHSSLDETYIELTIHKEANDENHEREINALKRKYYQK